MSPFQYLSITGRYEEFKMRIIKSSLNRFKQENLLFEGDLDKYARNFIARNLVDTRYATREILNMLKKYYSDNEERVKIKSVTGLMTSQVRKMWEFGKSREVSHAHHAQDALIILVSEKILNRLSNVKDFYDAEENKTSVNMKTGEILSDDEYRKLFKHEYGERIKNYARYRYSHYVDKKPNRQLTDETIYSTRKVVEMEKKGKREVEVENEYIITTLSGIYDKTNKNIKKFFEDEKKQKQLLMYHHDPKTFEKFMEVYKEYKKEANPFFAYYDEHKKFITKYAKKDNGPPVMSIKYRQSQLGNHLDLSHKYNVKDKKVVMLSIPALRADFYKKDNTWKFVTVTYLMMQDRGRYYDLNREEYNRRRENKEIDGKYEFMFSLYSGDILEVEKIDGTKEKFKFKGVNNDGRNTLEIDFVDKFNGNYIEGIKKLQEILKSKPDMDTNRFHEIVFETIGEKIDFLKCKEFIQNYPVSSKQKFLTIGREVESLRKIYTDALGQEYSSKEKFISRIYK